MPTNDPASEAAYRAAVAKYGSDEVARPCDFETLFLDASRGVAPHERGRLQEVARFARPLPRTIGEALDEWLYIERRDRVKREFFPTRGVCPALRERAVMLAQAIMNELPVNDLADLECRLRLFEALSRRDRDGLAADAQNALAKALLDDVHKLKASLQPGEPQVAGTAMKSATERRAEVVARLCDPETSKWSDRAIAKACGVSPQTVSNWRRKLSDLGEADGPENRERFYRRRGAVHRMRIRAIGHGASKNRDEV